MDLSELMNTEIVAGNTLWRIAGLFGLLLVGFTAGKLLKFLLSRRAEQLREPRPIIAATLGAIGRAAPFLAFALGLAAGTSLLILNGASELVGTCVAIVVTLAISWTAICLVDAPKTWMTHRAGQTESKLDDMLAPIVSKSLIATIVVLTVVQIAQVLSGKEITSILAGLGIGGLAFALAAQDTIKNLFGSMVLLADRPFEVGDRIVVDGTDGTVETVGMRSTRVRTLTGHLVTIPNGELANKAIENISKRPHIRRIFNITITYDTPPAKVREAKAIIEDIMKDHEGMDPEFPPRVFFNEFQDCALNLFCIYWYHPALWWDYLALTERINMEILERFNEAGIDFAFPTQTVHLAGDPSRPLEVGVKGN
jgi:MscS family membrane protein